MQTIYIATRNGVISKELYCDFWHAIESLADALRLSSKTCNINDPAIAKDTLELAVVLSAEHHDTAPNAKQYDVYLRDGIISIDNMSCAVDVPGLARHVHNADDARRFFREHKS
jgi:hypothetical protein